MGNNHDERPPASLTVGAFVSMAVYALMFATALASFAYSYGTTNSNILYLERGRIENQAAISQLQQNDALVTAALADLRVATATLNQQVIALRADLERARAGRTQQ